MKKLKIVVVNTSSVKNYKGCGRNNLNFCGARE